MAGGEEGLWPPLLSDMFALGACSPVTGSSAGARGGARSSWAGVFHRVVSGSGVGGVGAGSVNTPLGRAVPPGRAGYGVVSAARRLP